MKHGVIGPSSGPIRPASPPLRRSSRRPQTTVPVIVLAVAVAIALVVGVTAGLYPALRAARLAPAEALRVM